MPWNKPSTRADALAQAINHACRTPMQTNIACCTVPLTATHFPFLTNKARPNQCNHAQAAHQMQPHHTRSSCPPARSLKTQTPQRGREGSAGANNTGEEGAHRGIVQVACQVLAVYERLYALLQVRGADGELELDEQLPHQQLVAQGLARLHHPHYGRIYLHTATEGGG